MFDRDFDEFSALLDGVVAANPNWKPLPPAGIAMFFKAMSAYTLAQFETALMAHIRDPKAGMFQPTPAHLIGHIVGTVANDGRPGADEAWAIALTAQNEADTVVWTQEMAEAFALCRPVLDMGDEVGARMAFKDAYARLVTAARAANVPAQWSASLGWDADKREAVLTKATTAGLLPPPTVAGLLPPAVGAQDEADTGARAQIEKIREMMAQAQAERQRNADLHAQREREATARAKADAQDKVDGYRKGAAA